MEVRRRGSHVVMQKVLDSGTRTVPVPDHREIRRGTLQSIESHSGASPFQKELTGRLLSSAVCRFLALKVIRLA